MIAATYIPAKHYAFWRERLLLAGYGHPVMKVFIETVRRSTPTLNIGTHGFVKTFETPARKAGKTFAQSKNFPVQASWWRDDYLNTFVKSNK